MKILGFLDRGVLDPPSAPLAPAPGGLRDEDPGAYRELIESLTESDQHRDELRRTLFHDDAFVVVTGQQPALLGGPLYTLYKVLTAVEHARRVRLQGGSAVAAFWCVGDDTDFGEVAHTSWPIPGGAPRRVKLEGGGNADRIGGLAASQMGEAIALLKQDFPGAPGLRLLDGAVERSLRGDWSAFLRESLAVFVGEEPLLFVDGNAAPVVRASQGFLVRFAPERPTLAAALDREAGAARARGEDPPLGAEEGIRCLFAFEGRGRRVLGPDEDSRGDAPLGPNVVLRPALQEHLLPIGQVVCGDAEIAYRRLLGPVYSMLGRPAAPLMRRFGATLLPPPWSSDAPDPEAAIADPDGLLEEWSVGSLPDGAMSRVLEARKDVRGILAGLERSLEPVDRSLLQLLESARGKMDFQMGRIEEGVRAKARQALYRRYPVLAHLREFVIPRGRQQERSFSLWTPLAWDGPTALADLAACVSNWFDRGERGHALMALEREEPDS